MNELAINSGDQPVNNPDLCEHSNADAVDVTDVDIDCLIHEAQVSSDNSVEGLLSNHSIPVVDYTSCTNY